MNPQKPLLILDLDETLIHATSQQLSYAGAFTVFHYHVYIRPHLKTFLEEVIKHYQLAIWSSASDDYVAEVVSKVIPPTIPLQFVWGRSRCTFKLSPKIDELGYLNQDASHYHYIKIIKKMKRRGFKMEQVLIVDDTPRKVQNSYGNAIYPKAFTGQKDDDELLFLARYLKKIANHPNYRALEKRFWRQEISDSNDCGE